MKWKWKWVAQSCLTLCHLMDHTFRGVLQARILEWVAFPLSRGSSQPRDPTQVLHCRWILYLLSHKGNLRILEWVAYAFFSRSSRPGIELGSPALQTDSLPTELWLCWTFHVEIYLYNTNNRLCLLQQDDTNLVLSSSRFPEWDKSRSETSLRMIWDFNQQAA